MSDSEDAFEDLPEELQQAADEFDRRRLALYDCVCEFMDDEEIDEGYMAQLLLDCGLNMRMTAYGMAVENPSVAGLKIDLDRVGREVGEMLRTAKKGAEEFIHKVKEERARLQAEVDEAEPGDEKAE